jgi:phytoene dehydrogenase-like protein
MSKPTVHIIGSGISGLRCAEIVLDSGLDVKIYEKSERIGGRMKTDIVDGFLLDRGFHVMQTGYPHSISKIDFESLGSEAFSPGKGLSKL